MCVEKFVLRRVKNIEWISVFLLVFDMQCM